MAINFINPVSNIGADMYNTVDVSQTAFTLARTQGGNTGAVGDYLNCILLQVATAANGAVSVLDGSTTIFSFAASPGGGIGVYVVPLGITSKSGAWKITTGSGVTVLATGRFT